MIKYQLKKIKKDIFVVCVKNQYDLGMLFLKAQEFYESPKFSNKKFSIWDYFDWYSKNHGGVFSYPKDYSGYNLPLKVARKCYKINSIESPYDLIFKKILRSIKSLDGYLIGVDNLKSCLFMHELCHGLYYTNSEYRERMDDITKNIAKSSLQKFSKNLKSKGYCSSVLLDEIQAYMATEKTNAISKGIANLDILHKKYKKVLKDFL